MADLNTDATVEDDRLTVATYRRTQFIDLSGKPTDVDEPVESVTIDAEPEVARALGKELLAWAERRS